MTRTYTILFLLFVCLQSQAYSLPFLSNPPTETPTINAIQNSGEIALKKDSQGFYVDTDLLYSPINPPGPLPDPQPRDTVKMTISLSNDQTIAASNCLNFTDYNSSRYNWRYNFWETSVSYPNFLSRHAIAGFAYVYLDYKYWGMSNGILLIASLNSCETRDNTSAISLDRYGVLGFGTKDRGAQNFKTSKKANFSVFIQPDLSSGKIIFTNDTANYTISPEPIHKWTSNANWRLNIPRGHVIVKNYSADFNYGEAIFDVNSDAIGLPSDLFKWFMSNLALVPEISCSDDLYKPDCKTNGSLSDLPDITLAFNDTKIRIPSKIYASPNGDKKFKLNLKATSPDLSGPSFVTLEFKDSIILGAPFMSYYFTVFDASSGANVISLYPTVREISYKWVMIGAVGLVLLVLIAYCIKRKIAASKLTANIAKESFAYNYTSYNQRINPN